jgi:hypothetical protein
MKLILDTLERARLAASPSDADDLRIGLAALESIADALARNGWTLDEAPGALDALAAVVNHVAAQPFETDANCRIYDEATPDAFAVWLGELERLAQ